MPEVSRDTWDDFIHKQADPHLLQTGEWGDLKAAFGWRVVRVLEGDTGAQILFRQLPLGYSLAYIARGPVGPNPKVLWPQIDTACQNRRAVFLKIEPDEWEDDNHDPKKIPHGFILSEHSIQPPRTIIIDINEPEDAILARMKQKTRYNISLARRKDIEVVSSADIQTFHQMAEETGLRSEFGVHSRSYYQEAYDQFYPRGLCELLFATYDDEPLAGLMVFASGSRAWYFYGASTQSHRNRMPTYLLQWEAIRWARLKGCAIYDLWGIPDATPEKLEGEFSDRHDGLWGVYRFKRGFGGENRRTIGPWDRIYKPGLYQIYKWMVGRRTS